MVFLLICASMIYKSNILWKQSSIPNGGSHQSGSQYSSPGKPEAFSTDYGGGFLTKTLLSGLL